MSDALTTTEAADLAELESRIEAGAEAIWISLADIRERRLYRNTHASFEDYCNDRWGWTRQHANRLIAAGETMALLAPIGFHADSERAFRPLTGLTPEQAIEAAEEVMEAVAEAGEKKPTAALVEESAKRRKGGKKKNPQELREDYGKRKEREAKKKAAPEPESAEEIMAALNRSAAKRSETAPPALAGAGAAQSASPVAGETKPAGASASPFRGPASSTTQPKPEAQPVPSAFKVRDAMRAGGVVLNDPTEPEKAVLTAADREWFQAVNRWAQLWLLACPSAKSEAA